MTKAERLLAQRAREQEALTAQKNRVAAIEAALREETRKATNKRRYHVGALAEEAGLFAWRNTELAGLFAALARLREVEHPVAELEALLSEPKWLAVGSGNGVAEASPRVRATP